MAPTKMTEPWGRLTRQEVYKSLPADTLTGNLRTWAELAAAIRLLSPVNMERVRKAAEAKEEGRRTQKRKATSIKMANLRTVRRKVELDSVQDFNKFMALPSGEEIQNCITAFLDATGNDALRHVVCVICARELMEKQCTWK